MIYLLIYIIGVIISFGYLLLYEDLLEDEYLTMAIVSIFWPLVSVVIIGHILYDSVVKIINKGKNKRILKVHCALRDNMLNDRLNKAKNIKSNKPFKFGH